MPGEASPGELLADQVTSALRSAPLGLLRRGLDVLETVTRPREAAARAADVVRTVSRSVTPSAGGSPLLAPRGGGWHFEVLEVPLDALKAGAKAAGGSLNDGLLAAVLGGFRRYHERFDAPVDVLTLGIPISLRTQDDPQGGNRFTGARFAGPMAEPDPAVRVAAVREFVLSARSAAQTGVVDSVLAPTLGWLPAPVLGAVSGRLTSANDVQVSTVPGVPHPVYIAGSRIDRMYPFGPLPGCAAMITLISHDGVCCIGVNTDRAAVTDPAALAADLQSGLDEVRALSRRRPG
jgi:hypothetical protein